MPARKVLASEAEAWSSWALLLLLLLRPKAEATQKGNGQQAAGGRRQGKQPGVAGERNAAHESP